MKRRKLSCVWLAAAVLFLAGCSSQEEKGMAQVSVITSASEESTSETETENCEETSQAEPVSESEYETGEMWEAEMEPDKVYRISAVWEESKAQERGFSGEAEYAVLTE